MFWRRGGFSFYLQLIRTPLNCHHVTADGDLVLDSWLGSFVSCHRWKWIYNLSRLQQRKSPHQNQRVYRFTCSSGFRCQFGRYSFSVSLRRYKHLLLAWSLQVFLSWNDVVRWLFSYLSVLNLCSLVLDRYIAIVKPFKYITFMTRSRVIQVITSCWIASFTLVALKTAPRLCCETPLTSIVAVVVLIPWTSFHAYCKYSVLRQCYFMYGQHAPQQNS